MKLCSVLAMFVFLLTGSIVSMAADISAVNLRCEYLDNPLGIDNPVPMLSWLVSSGKKIPKGQGQGAYHLLVASSEKILKRDKGDLWDSGKVVSDLTAHIKYAGSQLKSRQQCFWKVKVYDKDGKDCGWSEPAKWEMGFLVPADWSAKWIEGIIETKDASEYTLEGSKWIWFPEPGVNLAQTAPPAIERVFRCIVELPAGKKVASARLLLTVDDEFVLYVNGNETGKDSAKDGWRNVKNYDLKPVLTEGRNVIALQAKNNEHAAGVSAKLHLKFDDGASHVVISDKAWKVSDSGDGDWKAAGFDDSSWKDAAEILPVGQGPWGDFVQKKSLPVPILRKTVQLADKSIESARLYITALGLYEMHINGGRVGDIMLAPEWTDYNKRVRYQVYDVTSMLKKGKNVMAALLGNGWYCGRVGWANSIYGKVPALLAQLEVTYSDGTVERIISDDTWKKHESPIMVSDFMTGERYDARKEIKCWDNVDMEDSSWESAAVRTEKDRPIQAQVTQPVGNVCEVNTRTVTESQPAHWVFDLGQNMVGYIRLKVSAPAGTTVTIRHAEMLNPDGTIYTTNLRKAESTDTYTCKGDGIETYQPRFTFHGFRYVEVTGIAEKPGKDMITGVVLTSKVRRTGQFACSDERINQLYSNIWWGQIGNYLSVPTDCPQRDERLGWMGDAQVFIRTATYNADVEAFYHKWLVDVDDGQNAEGSFGDVSPNVLGWGGVPAWGDAGVICPWTIYYVYGDKRILEEHLPAMTKWVEWCRAHSQDLIREKDRGNDYGDWLSIGANTPKDLIGTAYFAYSTKLLAKSYEAVGNKDAADKYEKLFNDIRASFNKKYVAADGRIHGNTQSCYLMALKFDLLSDEMRIKAAQYLDEDIKSKNDHLSTGFVGVSYLLPVLTTAGKMDTVFKLFQQDTFPSWLFSVKHGATTIWERWDGWTPEKGFQDAGMNSFNHYSLGSCGEWMFASLAGIDTDGPGFKRLIIKPRPGGDISWTKASYDSVNGEIAVSWEKGETVFKMNVTIPLNTTASIYVPASDRNVVKESGKPAEKSEGVKFLRMEDGYAVFAVGSGVYEFTAEG